MNRRIILAALGAAVFPGGPTAAADRVPRLRILILGGTRFIGRHLVDNARARGYTVTLFNRGKSNPGLFPDVEQLRGDRADDLASLRGRDWDVVVDTSGYVPRHVRESAGLLADHVRQYVFISSISAYAGFERQNDENSPLATTVDELAEKVTDDNYGALKVLCEKEVGRAFPGRATIVRPGYVVGPEDYTDRFTYWPVRVARGGEMLAPGAASDPIQFIDVRDLAAFCIACAETRTSGVFNAVHAPGFVTMGGLLDRCRAITAGDAAFTWVPADFLLERKLLEQIPIWSPAAGKEAGAALTGNARAVAAGLQTTALDTTIRDTLAWQRARPAAEQAKPEAGLDPDVERRTLAEWHAQSAARG